MGLTPCSLRTSVSLFELVYVEVVSGLFMRGPLKGFEGLSRLGLRRRAAPHTQSFLLLLLCVGGKPGWIQQRLGDLTLPRSSRIL